MPGAAQAGGHRHLAGPPAAVLGARRAPSPPLMLLTPPPRRLRFSGSPGPASGLGSQRRCSLRSPRLPALVLPLLEGWSFPCAKGSQHTPAGFTIPSIYPKYLMAFRSPGSILQRRAFRVFLVTLSEGAVLSPRASPTSGLGQPAVNRLKTLCGA